MAKLECDENCKRDENGICIELKATFEQELAAGNLSAISLNNDFNVIPFPDQRKFIDTEEARIRLQMATSVDADTARKYLNEIDYWKSKVIK